jgi:hypothetical protein
MKFLLSLVVASVGYVSSASAQPSDYRVDQRNAAVMAEILKKDSCELQKAAVKTNTQVFSFDLSAVLQAIVDGEKAQGDDQIVEVIVVRKSGKREAHQVKDAGAVENSGPSSEPVATPAAVKTADPVSKVPVSRKWNPRE